LEELKPESRGKNLSNIPPEAGKSGQKSLPLIIEMLHPDISKLKGTDKGQII
jgi:hypothetical protein